METQDINKLVRDVDQTVRDFKSKHEERYNEIEAKLWDIEAAIARPVLGGAGGGRFSVSQEEVQAFNAFLRAGEVNAAMKVGEDPAGGYFVPPHVSELITSRIFESSPIRQLARTETISEDAFEEPLDLDEAGANWVGETESRSETDTPDIGMFRVPLHEVNAEPRVTQKLLDTASYDVSGWLEGKIVNKFARTEAAAFVNGDGVGKPRGILSYEATAEDDAARAWGKLQYIPTGAAGAFAGSDPADPLIDCVYSLKSDFRQGAQWLMARSTAGAVRKLKDADGNYLWQQSATAGQPDTFLGFPVTLAEDMPAIGSDSLSIAFGNFQRGYIVVDHRQMTILRDPFTTKPWVKFYTSKRVGGDVFNFEAIKLVKFAAS